MLSQKRHIALELKPIVLTLNSRDTLYSVAAVLYLQSVLHVMLCRMLNVFCTFTLALSVVCLQCAMWLFLFIIIIIIKLDGRYKEGHERKKPKWRPVRR